MLASPQSNISTPFVPKRVGFSARLFAADTPRDLIEEYTGHVGRMRRLPNWVQQGAVLGVQGGTAEVQRKLERVRAAGVPVAALWIQDWVGTRVTSFGKQLWWNWEVDSTYYPDWAATVANWSAEGIYTLVYVNPVRASRGVSVVEASCSVSLVAECPPHHCSISST